MLESPDDFDSWEDEEYDEDYCDVCGEEAETECENCHVPLCNECSYAFDGKCYNCSNKEE